MKGPSILRAPPTQLVIVMSHQPLTDLQILAKYRKKWSIKELCRKLKTSGFHRGNTHMKQSGQLVSLLIILAFGLLMASFTGHENTVEENTGMSSLLGLQTRIDFSSIPFRPIFSPGYRNHTKYS